MPPEAQTRLLRVLADGEFYRVGGHTAVKVDVRIITATHQDLEALVEQNRFREDLFHRLNVIRVHLPKLSDRREDIPELMKHFFNRAAKELDMEPKLLSQEAEDFLFNLPWPGNVRQLENICRWLTVMAAGREVLLSDLPPELREEDVSKDIRSQGDWQHMLRRWTERELNMGRQEVLAQAVPEFERTMIETALAHTGGRKKDAAQLLGWGRNTLTRKLQEYSMENQAL
jgi:two-component system nitrogen regulation response regulator GlnG